MAAHQSHRCWANRARPTRDSPSSNSMIFGACFRPQRFCSSLAAHLLRWRWGGRSDCWGLVICCNGAVSGACLPTAYLHSAGGTPRIQHPAASHLWAERVPADMNPTSFRLAVETLERLYDVPLIAPRAFHRAAWPRRRTANPTPTTSRVHLQPPQKQEQQQQEQQQEQLKQGQSQARGQTLDSFDESTRNGLVGESNPGGTSGGGHWRAMGSASGQGATVDTSVAQMSSGPDPGSGLAGKVSVLAAAGTAVAAVAAAESNAAARPLNVDPRAFPKLPPRLLATLLLDCAVHKVPLRLSVLQSYLKVVSDRVSELGADDMVSVLDGLSKYSFQSRPLGSSMAPAAAAASTAATAARSSRTGTDGGGGGFPSPSPPGGRWAIPILKALLLPPHHHRSSELAAATTNPAAPAAALPSPAAGGEPHGRGSSCTSSSSSSRTNAAGDGSADGAPVRLGSLEPARLVKLVHLLVQLNVRPPKHWMDGFLRSSSHLIPRMNGGQLIRLLELLAALAAAPAAEWWDVVLNAWPPTGPHNLPSAEVPNGMELQWDPVSRGSSEAGAEASRCGGGAGAGGGGGDNVGITAAAVANMAESASHATDALYGCGSRDGGHDYTILGGEVGRNGVDESSPASELSPRSLQPSALEVRSAIMYGMAQLGQQPQALGTTAATAALTAQLPSWGRATLYDIARAVLVSRQVAAAAAAAAAGADVTGTGGASAGGVNNRAPSAAAAANLVWPPPPPPGPQAIAQALAGLSAAMPPRMAARWASDTSGGSCGVLAVLVTALEPRLRQLGPELLLDLLRGLAAARVHPGPRFLLLHAMILKARVPAGELSPQQLLLAAKCYTKLGLSIRGGLRIAVLQAAREAAQGRAGRKTAKAEAMPKSVAWLQRAVTRRRRS